MGKRPPPICPAELYILLAGKGLVAFLPFLRRRGLQALDYNLDIEPHSSWMSGDKVQRQILDFPAPPPPPSDHHEVPEAKVLLGQETQDLHPGRQLGVTERSWTLEPNSLGANLRPITPFLCDFRKIPPPV